MGSVSVVVSTYNRAQYLPDLLAALDAQTLGDFEVVIVDNGSGDESAAILSSAAVQVVTLPTNRGPGGGRNAGVAATRGDVIAFTDDDCIPQPTWLEHLVTAFDDPAVVVAQGRTDADPAGEDQMGPFDHTIRVRSQTPFFETCNVAYRRDAFDRVGGFDETDPVLHPKTGRAFGEDATLGAAVVRDGGTRAYVDDAVVFHRCVPMAFARHLDDQRQLRLFPALARRTPLLKDLLFGGVFLNRTTALFDLGVVGVVLSLLLRQPVLALLVVPWLVRRGRAARWFTRGNPQRWLALLARYGISDAVTFASLLEGSVRHRRLIL